MRFIPARRTVAALTVALAAGAALAAPAHAATRTTITAKPATTKVYVSAGDRISGAVSPASTGRRVYLQRYSGGKWTSLTSTTTSRGAYALTFRPTSATTYTLRVYSGAYGSAVAAASASFKVAAVKRASTVTAKLDKTSLPKPSGSTYPYTYVRGAVGPAVSGRVLYLQRYDYDRRVWVTMSSAKTVTYGKYTLLAKLPSTVVPNDVSLNLRVYVPATASAYSVSSSAFMLKVLLDAQGSWATPDNCFFWQSGSQLPNMSAPARCWVGM